MGLIPAIPAAAGEMERIAGMSLPIQIAHGAESFSSLLNNLKAVLRRTSSLRIHLDCQSFGAAV